MTITHDTLDRTVQAPSRPQQTWISDLGPSSDPGLPPAIRLRNPCPPPALYQASDLGPPGPSHILLVVTSGDHHWISVQTCSFEVTPGVTSGDGHWNMYGSRRCSTHPNEMPYCFYWFYLISKWAKSLVPSQYWPEVPSGQTHVYRNGRSRHVDPSAHWLSIQSSVSTISRYIRCKVKFQKAADLTCNSKYEK